MAKRVGGMSRSELISEVWRLEAMLCDERLKLYRRNGAKHRIACADCDTDDGDGITIKKAEANGWTGLMADMLKADGEDILKWWDVLGYCYECVHGDEC